MDLGSDPARLPKRSLRMLVGHLIVPFICACQGVRLCPLESPRALALQRRAVAVLHRWSGSKEIVRFWVAISMLERVGESPVDATVELSGLVTP